MPERIQLRRVKGWRMPANTVKVTRPGPWGNPFVVGKHGTARECVELFRILCAGYLNFGVDQDCFDAQLKFTHRGAHLAELRGKNLACWCKPGTPCHADVLLEMANERSQP